MKFAKVSKGTRLGPWLAAVLCALLLTYTSPRKAEATAVEYAVMLALIIVVCITAITESPGTNHAYTVVGDQLKAAVKAAQDANSGADTPKEIAALSEAIGSANAMMAIASSCDDGVADCTTLQNDLRVIIGEASGLKRRALNLPSICNADGVIERGEACDPNAGGCPDSVLIDGNLVPTVCSDQCLCEPGIIP